MSGAERGVSTGARRSLAAAFVLAAVAMALAPAAPAQPGPPGPRPPGIELQLSAQASRELPNDEAQLVFFVESQDPLPQRAVEQVNRGAREAVERIKRAQPAAVVQTPAYSTFPQYDPRISGKIVGWRVRQEIAVRTRELESVSALAGVGQETAALGTISFTVSEDARRRAEGAIVEEAVARLRERAGHLARALGANPAELRFERIELEPTGVPPPRPMVMRAEAAAAAPAAAPPSFEPGSSRVTLTVSGLARLPR